MGSIQIPDAILKATADRFPIRNMEDMEFRRDVIEIAIRWIMSEVERLELCMEDYRNFMNMFTAPDAKVPDAVRQIAKGLFPDIVDGEHIIDVMVALTEAYHRGQREHRQ